MRSRLPAIIATAACALVTIAPAAHATQRAGLSTSPGTPASEVITLTIAASRSIASYGTRVAISGVLSPATAAPLVVESRAGDGSWNAVATTSTEADGSWSVRLRAVAGAKLRARLADDSAVSPSTTIAVTPIISVVSAPAAPAFAGVRMLARVLPSSYGGRVTLRQRYLGRTRGVVSRRPRDGVLRVTVPNVGIGRLPVLISLGAGNGLRATTAATSVRATTTPLAQGSMGPYVRAVVHRLRALRLHTPRSTGTFDSRVGDAVLAFHKSRGMVRSTTVDAATWRRLATASPMRPRFASPALHIEVDKTRQILSVVRDGRILGTIHVSTGATGNTPVGRFRIHQRGGSNLFRFMAFIGNYGIHGYPSVPAFPASHGCVREPMWTASWTYGLVELGTTVIIHT